MVQFFNQTTPVPSPKEPQTSNSRLPPVNTAKSMPSASTGQQMQDTNHLSKIRAKTAAPIMSPPACCSKGSQSAHFRRNIASSTIHLSSEKPIVRTPRPQDFNNHLLKMTKQSMSTRRCPTATHSSQAAADRRRWTTTTKVATDEYALPTPRYSVPTTTLELCADSVRYRARETSPKPFLWQTYTREWDMKQLRHPAQKAGINLPDIPKNRAMVQVNNEMQSRPKLTRQHGIIMDLSSEHQNYYQLQDETALFTRPMPGYGGFVPHHPVDPKPISDDDCVTASMCSTSRRTYRSYPAGEYKELTFSHRGPLSKTITLTAPFNPFNKVEQC